MLVKTIACACITIGLFGSANAQTPKPKAPPFLPLSIPYTTADPLLDGQATSAIEWAQATRTPDVFYSGGASRAGAWYAQSRLDWEATSLLTPPNVTPYAGTTVFLAHDLVGSSDPANPLHQFQVQADTDWASFRVPVPAGTAQIWVFANGNAGDDSTWLPFADGLLSEDFVPEGVPPDIVNDIGFIARLNDDPTTDVHWIPGLDPEPGDTQALPDGGDPTWVWEDWHHVFGRASFGQPFQANGLDPAEDNAVDHEVYEIAFYRPDFSAGADGEPPPPWNEWWNLTSVEEAGPWWLGGAVAGTPLKPFTVKQLLKKPVPVLRSDFWLRFRSPAMPDPTAEQDRDAVVAQLEQLKFDAPPSASIPLSRVQAFLVNAYDEVADGDVKGGYANLKLALKNAKDARKEGVRQDELLEPLTNIAALFFGLAVERVIAVDDDGLPATDKALRKAYRSVYGVGRGLGVGSTKGDKAKLTKVVMKTRKIFQAAEKAEKRLALQQQP